jgi:hypothetical protein
MQTMGPPPKHKVSPDSVAKILAIKQDIAGLLK